MRAINKTHLADGDVQAEPLSFSERVCLFNGTRFQSFHVVQPTGLHRITASRSIQEYLRFLRFLRFNQNFRTKALPSQRSADSWVKPDEAPSCFHPPLPRVVSGTSCAPNPTLLKLRSETKTFLSSNHQPLKTILISSVSLISAFWKGGSKHAFITIHTGIWADIMWSAPTLISHNR